MEVWCNVTAIETVFFRGMAMGGWIMSFQNKTKQNINILASKIYLSGFKPY